MLLRQQLRRRQRLLRQNPIGHDAHIRPLPQHRYRRVAAVIAVHALAAPGIADCHRSAAAVQCRAQHAPQLRETGGAQHRHVGDLGQIVDAPVVRLAVGPHQTGAVHGKDHVELVQRHVLCQHVVAPLQKAVVHREYRQHALLGHARRHGHCVPLGDADIEKPAGMGSGKGRQACALRHGCRDGADMRVLVRQHLQLLPEHRGERRLGRRAGPPRGGIEGGYAVEALRCLFRRGVALPFPGVDMQQHGTVLLPRRPQHIRQPPDIVAVHRPHVRKAHVLEHGAHRQQ